MIFLLCKYLLKSNFNVNELVWFIIGRNSWFKVGHSQNFDYIKSLRTHFVPVGFCVEKCIIKYNGRFGKPLVFSTESVHHQLLWLLAWLACLCVNSLQHFIITFHPCTSPAMGLCPAHTVCPLIYTKTRGILKTTSH